MAQLIVIQLFIIAICGFYREEVFTRMVNFVFYPKSVTSPHFPPILLGSLCSLLTCYIFFFFDRYSGKCCTCTPTIKFVTPRVFLCVARKDVIGGSPPLSGTVSGPSPAQPFQPKEPSATQLRQRRSQTAAKERRQLKEKEKDTEKSFFLSRQIGSPRQPRAAVAPPSRPDPAPGRPARTPRRLGENPDEPPERYIPR